MRSRATPESLRQAGRSPGSDFAGSDFDLHRRRKTRSGLQTAAFAECVPSPRPGSPYAYGGDVERAARPWIAQFLTEMHGNVLAPPESLLELRTCLKRLLHPDWLHNSRHQRQVMWCLDVDRRTLGSAVLGQPPTCNSPINSSVAVPDFPKRTAAFRVTRRAHADLCVSRPGYLPTKRAPIPR